MINKLTTALISVLLILFLSCKNDDRNSFKIFIEKEQKDSIKAGSMIQLPIIIENKTNKDVTILEIAESCNCTELNLKTGTVIKKETTQKFFAKIKTDSIYKNKLVNVVISIKTNHITSIYSIEKDFYLY
jgi:hypothetical protein